MLTDLHDLCFDAQKKSEKAKQARKNVARQLNVLITKVAELKKKLKEMEALEIMANAEEKDAWRNLREANND